MCPSFLICGMRILPPWNVEHDLLKNNGLSVIENYKEAMESIFIFISPPSYWTFHIFMDAVDIYKGD